MEYNDIQELQNEQKNSFQHEEKKDNLLVAPKEKPEEPGLEKQEKLENKEKQAPAEQEQAERFRETMNSRIELARAEKAAKGAALGEFVPANRGVKGWIQKQRDTSTLDSIKRERNNPNLTLYSMRIANRLDKLEEEDEKKRQEAGGVVQEDSLSDIAKEAFGWRLSWSMTDFRYFWHHAEEMRSMFQKADRIKIALENQRDALNELPEPQRKVLSAIVNVVNILRASVESNLLAHGVNAQKGRGQKIINGDRVVKMTQKRCKMQFDTALNELMQLERQVNLTEQEQAAFLEHECAEQYEEAMTDLSALWDKNQVQLANKGNVRYINGPVAMMRLIRGDSDEDSLALYMKIRNYVSLSTPNALTDEEKKTTCLGLESLFREVLKWDVNEFAYQSPKDFASPGYMKKRQKLYLAFELANAYNAYKSVFENDEAKQYVSFSKDVFTELSAKLSILQELYNFYSNAAVLCGNKKLMEEGSLEDWYGKSPEELLMLSATIEGKDEKETQALRGILGRLGSTKGAMREEKDPNYFLPGTDLTAFVNKERGKYGLSPEGVQDEKDKKDAKDQQDKQDVILSYAHTLEQEALKMDLKDFKELLKKKTEQQLDSENPETVLQRFVTLANIASYYPRFSDYPDEQKRAFQTAISDTITDYVNKHVGIDMFRAFNKRRIDLAKTLLANMRKMMKEEIPTDIAPPLTKKKGEEEEEFATRQKMQKMQYLSLKFMDTKEGRELAALSMLEQDIGMVDFATGRVIGNDLVKTFEDAANLLSVEYENWMETATTDKEEKLLFALAVRNMSLKNEYNSLDKNAVKAVTERFDGEMKKEITQQAALLYL